MLLRGNIVRFCVINAIKSIDKHSFLRKVVKSTDALEIVQT